MAYKRFTTFLLKLKYNGNNNVDIIKKYITKDYQYIGIFKSKTVMYIYIQLKLSLKISEHNIRKNFDKLGKINGPFSFTDIDRRLQFVEDEGVLIKRGPKKEVKFCTNNIDKSVTNIDNSKHSKHIDNSVTNNITNNVTNNNEININPVGKEDTSGITCESIIKMIKYDVDSDVIKCKEHTKNCICYTSICKLHKKIGCESVHCRLTRGESEDRHNNATCKNLSKVFQNEPDGTTLDKFLYIVLFRHYCDSEGFRFYNIFEELLYKNIKNHNISIGNKDGKYSYFDGTEIVKGALMDNYYEDVIKKRISLLSERIDEIFEYWYKLEESYGYLEMHALKYFVTCLVYEISDLDKNQTQQETKELRNKTVLKTRYSDIGIIREMVHASKNRCKDNPIRTG